MDASDQLQFLEPLIEVGISKDNFLKIVETLTRIGISSANEKKLYPSCHILHKASRYFIVHFKHLMALDELPVNITDSDIYRYHTICLLLQQWKLLEIISPEKIQAPANLKLIKIIPFNQKDSWEIIPKFQISKNKK